MEQSNNEYDQVDASISELSKFKTQASFEVSQQRSPLRCVESALILGFGLIVTCIAAIALSDKKFSKEEHRRSLATVLVFFSLPLCICLCVLLNSNLTVKRVIPISILGIFLPGLLLSLSLLGYIDNLIVMMLSGYILTLCFFLLILKGLKTDLADKFSNKAATVVSITVIVFYLGFTMNYLVGTFLFNPDLTVDFWVEGFVFIEIGYLPLLIFLWSRGKFFQVETSSHEEFLNQLQSTMVANEFYELYKPNKVSSFMLNHGHIFNSLISLLVVLALEILMFILGLIKLESEQYSMALVIFYKLAVPIFLFAGLHYSGSKFAVDSKVNIAVFVGGPAIIVSVLLGDYAISQGQDVLGYLICFGVPISIFFWALMVFIHNSNKRCYQKTPPLLCLSVLIPIGVLWPLYADGDLSEAGFYSLLSLTLLIMLGYFALLVIEKLPLKAHLLLMKQRLKFIMVNNTVRVIYTSIIICTVFTISYLIIVDEITEFWHAGVGVSSIIILILGYIYSKVLVGVNMYNKSYPKYTFLEIIMEKVENSEAFLKSIKKKRELQLLISIMGFWIPASLLIVALSLIESDPSWLIICVYLMLGLFSLSFFVLVVLEMKTILRQHGKKFIHYGVGSMWLFFLLPFFVVLPIAFVYSSDSSSEVSSWCSGGVVMILMIGISCLSIFLNNLFRRLENEKLAKYCVSKLMVLFESLSVKIEDKIIRAIFDHYVEGEELNQLLKDRVFVDVFDIDDDPLYNKEVDLVSKIKQKVKTEEQDTAVTCMSLLRKYICKPKQIKRTDTLDENLAQVVPEGLREINTMKQANSINQDSLSEEESCPDQIEDQQIPGLEEIQPVEISEEQREDILQEHQYLKIVDNPAAKRGWLKTVFQSIFAHGKDHEEKASMNLQDMHQLIRLCGLEKKISSARIDLIYTKATKRYDRILNKIRYVKIDEDNFDEVLEEISKCVYSRNETHRFFAENFYPAVVTTFPFLRKIIRPLTKKTSFHVNDRLVEYNIEEHEQAEDGEINNIPVVPQENTKESCLRRFFRKSSACFLAFVNKTLKSLGVFGLFLFHNIFPSSPDKPTAIKQELERVVDRTSEDWETICDRVTETLDTLMHEWKVANNTIMIEKFKWNVANTTNIVMHVLEVYTYTSVALSSEINWSYFLQSADAGSDIVLAESSYWRETFILMVVLSFFFIFLVKPVGALVRQGRLGLNKDLTKAGFPQPQFFLEKMVVVLGSSLYLTIISGLLGVFSCHYNSENIWVVTRNSDLECFTGIYWLYCVLGAFCFLMYYPSATLLFPNIMYQNKNLDLKYDTTFLVFESQGKLLIAVASAFFPREYFVWLHVIVVIGVCSALSVYAFISKPCLVVSYNYWKASGYFVPVWASLCALVNYYTSYKDGAFIALLVGLASIIVVVISVGLIFRKKISQ